MVGVVTAKSREEPTKVVMARLVLLFRSHPIPLNGRLSGNHETTEKGIPNRPEFARKPPMVSHFLQFQIPHHTEKVNAENKFCVLNGELYIKIMTVEAAPMNSGGI